MPKTLLEQENLATAERTRRMSEPSREEDAPPSFARTVGMVGACFAVFGLGMWLYDTYRETRTFNPVLVRFWWLIGFVGLLYHAARDRDLKVRRFYGVLAFLLVMFGTTLTGMSIATEWRTPATTHENARIVGVAVAAVLGLALVIFTGVPFVREAIHVPEHVGWVSRFITGVKTNDLVQKVVFFGSILAAAAVLASFLLFNKYTPSINFSYYGLASLLLGLIFLLPYTANETEPNWRDAAIYPIGVVGAVAALVGLSSVLTDWLNLEEILLPYGLIFGVFGLILLWIFTALKGTTSTLGYRTAVAIGSAGLAVAILAAARSFIPQLAFANPSLHVPTGFLLITLGLAYAVVGWFLAGDNRLLVMTRRELAAYFFSPIAYIVIAGMAVIAWVSFLFFFAAIDPNSPTGAGVPIQEPVLMEYFYSFFVAVCLTIFVPFTTMRLLSEEQRTATIEVLLTAPVGETAVVLSKFFAALIFFMLGWGAWGVFPLALRIIGQEAFDYRPLLTFFFGMTFMSAGFISMGLFCSSITKNQIIAALLTFVGMMLLLLPALFMDMRAEQTKLEAMRYMFYLHHLREFVQGKVFLHYIVFHLSLTVFWLFLSVKILEARKWR